MKTASRFVIPKWSDLRLIGNTYPARLSIIVPFLGYLILSQAYVASFLSKLPLNDQLNAVGSYADIGFNFYSLYFGLFVFGVASFLFFSLCDPCVKRFSDADEFYLHKRPACTSSDIQKCCSYVISNAAGMSEEVKTAQTIMRAMTSGVQACPAEESVKFALKTYYEIKDDRFKIARIIVGGLFALGLVLIVLPSLLTFWKIFVLLVSGWP